MQYYNEKKIKKAKLPVTGSFVPVTGTFSPKKTALDYICNKLILYGKKGHFYSAEKRYSKTTIY